MSYLQLISAAHTENIEVAQDLHHKPLGPLDKQKTGTDAGVLPESLQKIVNAYDKQRTNEGRVALDEEIREEVSDRNISTHALSSNETFRVDEIGENNYNLTTNDTDIGLRALPGYCFVFGHCSTVFCNCDEG